MKSVTETPPPSSLKPLQPAPLRGLFATLPGFVGDYFSSFSQKSGVFRKNFAIQITGQPTNKEEAS